MSGKYKYQAVFMVDWSKEEGPSIEERINEKLDYFSGIGYRLHTITHQAAGEWSEVIIVFELKP